MGILSIILLVLFVIASLLLILLVLVQDEQGEGLGGIFGGASNTPFGSRSGNVLTRFTSILAAFFLILSLGLA
ncbi:MAG: preprotein translocase subunit SecG, partial [Spirochaetia bacterium]|nr:preprotein translocase subunit SecG [Spirochaetia bacterium]